MLSSDPLEFTFLENPQQRYLRLGRELSDLVQEDRAAIGQLEPAEPALKGAGERALLVTEQLRGDQVAWNRRAVHGHEASRCTP
jgi:hypothetical protein